MSWIRETSLNIVEKVALNVVSCGDVPRHIAFIMDGNRRFASKNNVEKSEGHSKGFDKLAETLRWCMELGVKEVTVYAFSIENFKRSQEEVTYLLDLARQKFEKLLEEKEKLMREGVNIRVIGNLSLLPPDLVKLIARAVCMTKDNNKARLNVAFAYTSRDEMTCAARDIADGVADGELEDSDVTPSLVGAALYTQDSPPPDLLVRTSGEIRLSDFMLWQSSSAYIHFTPIFWPDFSFWHLLSAVVYYQRAKPSLPSKDSTALTPAATKFIKKLYEVRYKRLADLLDSEDVKPSNGES